MSWRTIRPPNETELVFLVTIMAYLVSFVVIAAVLYRLYIHAYHFTPPYLQAYRELTAARGLVERGAIAFGDGPQSAGAWRTAQSRAMAFVLNEPQSARYSSLPPGPGAGGAGGAGVGRGAAGGSGRVSEMEEVELQANGNFSSDVLARLEQDLRETSFRERERLVAALEADLPAGQSFLFPVMSRSNSSRMVLPPEFDLSLNGLNRASHSSRFSRVPVSPSPGSFRASAAWAYDQLPPHAQPFFYPPDPRSLSSRNFMLPPEFDMSSVHRASQSAPLSDLYRASQSARMSDLYRASQSAWMSDPYRASQRAPLSDPYRTSQSARMSDPYRASQSARMSDLNRASQSFRMPPPQASAQSNVASTSAAGGAAGGSGAGGSYRWATSPAASFNPRNSQ